MYHHNRNSSSYKKYSSSDQPRIKVETVVNSKLKKSNHHPIINEASSNHNQVQLESSKYGAAN